MSVDRLLVLPLLIRSLLSPDVVFFISKRMFVGRVNPHSVVFARLMMFGQLSSPPQRSDLAPFFISRSDSHSTLLTLPITLLFSCFFVVVFTSCDFVMRFLQVRRPSSAKIVVEFDDLSSIDL